MNGKIYIFFNFVKVYSLQVLYLWTLFYVDGCTRGVSTTTECCPSSYLLLSVDRFLGNNSKAEAGLIILIAPGFK